MAKKSQTAKDLHMTIEQHALIVRARKRFEDWMQFNQENYANGKDDLKAENGQDYWDAQAKAQRVADGRPCLDFNLLSPYIRDVVGEQRESRPNTMVSPVGTTATAQVAKIKEGYLRNVKYRCKADSAYDMGFGQQLRCGFGFFRILTEYEADDTFDQTFKVVPLANQFSVAWDSTAVEWHKNDGDWMGVYSHLSKDTFARKYPNVKPSNFDTASAYWYPKGDKKYTVLEYFEKEYEKKPLFQLSDGRVVMEEEIPDGVEKRVGAEFPAEHTDPNDPTGKPVSIVKKRSITEVKIYRYLVCGHAILEDKTLWASKYWPVIPIDGDEVWIEGKRHLRSLIRFAKDAVKAYSFSRSAEIEIIALVPKAPVEGTPAMFEGFEDQWDTAHKKTYSRLTWNPDPMVPGGKPSRLSGIDATYVQALSISTEKAKEEVRQTIGPNLLLPKSAQGLPNVSGTALGKWQSEGDISTFVFVDNLAKAIEWGDLVCVDLMKTILDTNRTITVRKIDGTTEEVEINKKQANQQTLKEETINDMTMGEYSVETNLGPSYAAQRAEQAETMLKFVSGIPQIAMGTADILASMLFQLQGHGGQGGPVEEFNKRIKKLLLKGQMIDATDLKPEEIKEFLPILLKKKQLPPQIMAKVKQMLADAEYKMAKAKESLAKAKMTQAEHAEKEMMIMNDLLGGMVMASIQTPPAGQQQGQLPMPGGIPT